MTIVIYNHNRKGERAMTIPTAGGVGVEQRLGAALCRRFATEGYHVSRSCVG
jgi:hypothetical protein